jgi:GntR family transcriptional regulator
MPPAYKLGRAMPSLANECAGRRWITVIVVSDRPVIDPNGPRLVYVQVADHIQDRIRSGTLPLGSRLPPERDLATEYGVSYDTIRRATALLRERGLIQTVHGRGTFVVAVPRDEA